VDPRFFVECWKVISLLLPIFLSDSLARLHTLKGRTNAKFLKTNILKKKLPSRRTFLFSSTICIRHTLLLVKSNSRKLRWLVVYVKAEVNAAFTSRVGKSTNEEEIDSRILLREEVDRRAENCITLTSYIFAAMLN